MRPMHFFATLVLLVSGQMVLAAGSRADLDRLELPAIDAAKLRAVDAGKTDPTLPLRYAIGHKVSAAATAGRGKARGNWDTLADGRHRWRLDVIAPGAVALDFGFSRYRLPQGAELWLIGSKSGMVAGPFTDADNKPSGEFWTPRVLGDAVRIELTVPAEKRAYLTLELGTVRQAYRDILMPQTEKSGGCNVDVVCSAGDAWRSQIRSVAAISFSESGSRNGLFCSGQLINSTGNTREPLFLTANHCGLTPGNAASVVAYFNFENSTCRAVGSTTSSSNGDGPLQAFLSGARLLAQTDASGEEGVVSSDFVLLRFDDYPAVAQRAFFTGWDRSGTPPANATTIHHPNGDEKRISRENDPLIITGYLEANGGGNTHWRIGDWDVGTTEPGSSGSGLWNAQGRLIGTLSGGYAACGNDLSDWYGRLTHQWDSGTTPQHRLKEWLDPAATGAMATDGVDCSNPPAVTLAGSVFGASVYSGETLEAVATASGGHGGPYRYRWDVDGDGEFERDSTGNSLPIVFPRAGGVQVRVAAIDTLGCGGSASHAVDVLGPRISATAGTPAQVCGNNDTDMDPGEVWRVPVQLSNSGSAMNSGGFALFVPGAGAGGALPFGPDAYGYQATTSHTGGCGYNFIDIAAGASAVTPLPTTAVDNQYGPLDDARTVDPIVLGGTGIRLYGETYTQAVMSTNGYIAFATDDSGGDYSNSCGGGDAGEQPRLQVLHDDLVVRESNPDGAAPGLRYRHFPTCPRPTDSGDPESTGGCHVFQWNGMQVYVNSSSASGNFDFQAIVYENSGEVSYQYRTADPSAGAGATIGLVSGGAGQGQLDVSCNEEGTATAQSAVCIFDPATLPATAGSAFHLAQPALPMPALAGNESATINVDVAIATGAHCGMPVQVDFLGAATSIQDASGDSAHILTTTVGNGNNCQETACLAGDPPVFTIPQIDAHYGLYYDPDRSGNGLLHFVYPTNPPVYGGIWYTARQDRTPTWYTVQGTFADNLGVAHLHEFTNTAAPSGFAPAGRVIGRAWIAQTAPEQIVFAWEFDDGRRGMDIQGTVGLPFSNPNRTGLWYSPAESGWGIGVESNVLGAGYNEFLAAFLYDASGIGRWVVGASGQSAGAVPMMTYLPHCPGCAYLPDWDQQPLPAGSLSRAYNGLDSVTVETSITLPAPLTGTWNRTLPMVPIMTPEQP